MPYRRRTTKRPRKTKRTRRARRRQPSKGGFRITRLMPAIGITKGVTAGLITSSNTDVLSFGTPVLSINGITAFYDVPFTMWFRLDQLQTYSDITAICDRYKILNAYVTIHGGNTAAAVGSNMPWIEYVTDADDNTPPTIAQLREKMGVRNKGFNQQAKLTFSVPKLRVADTIYQSGLSSAYAVPGKSMWVDAAYPSVPHYGVKGVLRAVYLDGSNNSNQMIVDVKLTVQCADLQ